jgi:hypothetical protein
MSVAFGATVGNGLVGSAVGVAHATADNAIANNIAISKNFFTFIFFFSSFLGIAFPLFPLSKEMMETIFLQKT